MNLADIREMTADELAEELAEAKEEQFNLRFQIATNQLDNTSRIKEVKKNIARILTVLRERDESSTDAAAPDGADEEAVKEKS